MSRSNASLPCLTEAAGGLPFRSLLYIDDDNSFPYNQEHCDGEGGSVVVWWFDPRSSDVVLGVIIGLVLGVALRVVVHG